MKEAGILFSEMKSLADQCKTFSLFLRDIIIHKKQVLLSITSLSMKIMKRLIALRFRVNLSDYLTTGELQRDYWRSKENYIHFLSV
jgi:hypothetical protein